MKYQNIVLKNKSNQMVKLIPIFSILFVSLFFVAILLTGDKESVTAKSIAEAGPSSSEPSLTTVSEVVLNDQATYLHTSADESKTTKQSGTSSSISNYVNAWKLSKATPVSQIIV